MHDIFTIKAMNAPKRKGFALPPLAPADAKRAAIFDARRVIERAETALARTLTEGERNDLVLDNFPTWPADFGRAIVAEIKGT